ncbi:invasion associated locus B family protein [Marivita sp. GX14005]|uniref:invasion associated locus B family protein n=1 Tax=Marivita sp. GX14005 TaxID=2942276 RepID=UPI002019F91D|nr:invasion associated locus B family protein [Marivita sp. GX14005]MCL3880676.1 invasion associated locus B family protein [Marivita sp. GX14005]
MTNPLFLMTTVAGLALAGMAAAQDSEADAPQGETPETAAETAAPEAQADTEPKAEPEAGGNDLSVLDTGETVNEGAASDETYVKTTHGDWAVQCLRVEKGQEPCQMYQLLKDANGGSVAEVSIFRLPENDRVAAGGTFVVPLETLLTEKLNVRVDTGQAKRYDYSFCTTVGCYARVGFTAQDVAAFKRGKEATVMLVPALAPDQRVTVTMSLSGFTAAYDEITALEQPAQQ